MVCVVNVESVDRIIYSIFQRFNLEWKTRTLSVSIYTSSLTSPTSPMSTPGARLLTLHPIRIIIQQPRATPPPCEIIT
jgi:hypothetical protein